MYTHKREVGLLPIIWRIVMVYPTTAIDLNNTHAYIYVHIRLLLLFLYFFKRYTIFSLFCFPGSFPTSFINSNGRWRWWSTEIHTHNRIEGSKYKTVSSKSTSSSSPCFLMRTHLLTFFFFRRRREELLPGTTEKEEKEIYIRPKQNIQKKKNI